jgi:hypothetical protein
MKQKDKSMKRKVQKAIYCFRLYTILEAFKSAKKGDTVDRKIVKQVVSLFKKLKRDYPDVAVLSSNAIMDKAETQCSVLSLQLAIAQVLGQIGKPEEGMETVYNYEWVEFEDEDRIVAQLSWNDAHDIYNNPSNIETEIFCFKHRSQKMQDYITNGVDPETADDSETWLYCELCENDKEGSITFDMISKIKATAIEKFLYGNKNNTRTQFCPQGHDKDKVGRNTEGRCSECCRIKAREHAKAKREKSNNTETI